MKFWLHYFFIDQWVNKRYICFMPKIINREEKQNQIAFGALEVFMEKGFENSRIIDIASAVGISKGLVYQYFDSKEEILLYVMNFLWLQTEQRVQALEELLSDERDLIRSAIDEICRFFDNDLMSLKKMTIIFTEVFSLILKGKVPELGEIFNRIVDSMKGMFERIIRRGVNEGVFRSDLDISEKSMLLVASLDGVGLHCALNPSRIDMMKGIESFLEMFFQSISAEKVQGDQE